MPFFSNAWNQSHYIEVTQGDIFYGTEKVIWAGFRLIGSTEKRSFGRLRATFKDVFFMFWGAKFYFLFYFENGVASTLKNCIM